MRMKRTLALVLALMLLVSALPMSAMAALQESTIYNLVFEKKPVTLATPIIKDQGSTTCEEGKTIKASAYETLVAFNGELYEFDGFTNPFVSWNEVIKKVDEYKAKNNPTPEMVDKYAKSLLEKTTYSFSKKDIKIDPYPNEADYNGDTAAFEKAKQSWGEKFAVFYAGYTPHQHKLSNWYFDNNNHWRECLVCKKYAQFHNPFMYMNWHYDGDGNDKCDVCTAPIIWYDITVEDVKGAKMVEVEGDKEMKARYNDKIVVEMEAEEGYILESIRFYKVRKDGTSEEITRYVETPGEVYRIVMPNFDVKIVPIVYPKG